MSTSPVSNGSPEASAYASQVSDKEQEETQVVPGPKMGRISVLMCGKKDTADIKEAVEGAIEEAEDQEEADQIDEVPENDPPRAGKCKPLPTWGKVAIGVAIVAAVVIGIFVGSQLYNFFSNGGLDTLKTLAGRAIDWMKNTALPEVARFMREHSRELKIGGGSVAGGVVGLGLSAAVLVGGVALIVKAVKANRKKDETIAELTKELGSVREQLESVKKDLAVAKNIINDVEEPLVFTIPAKGQKKAEPPPQEPKEQVDEANFEDHQFNDVSISTPQPEPKKKKKKKPMDEIPAEE